MKTMTYEQAKYVLSGYRWLKERKIEVTVNDNTEYYTLDVRDNDGNLRAFASVARKTAMRLKKEWNLKLNKNK